VRGREQGEEEGEGKERSGREELMIVRVSH